ncbi:rhomboid family intramembrane serine protease [Oceanobacillus caeni]|uniref:rhomboid family protein n=1 Tax=Oceanobacillus caeni TaxID=405946 RepID=UPI001C23F346|nr:rhomboid family intramembrane serine protease [Oceanobacillus caeni]MBU8789857.1 rhomboid family intramembrane serine protease [Oceanobacillus caeni]
MDTNDSYIMHTIASKLVNREGYEVIHINPKEIWLEQYKNKHSNIVRLTLNGYDWKNHLKKDIFIVLQKVSKMKRPFKSRKMTLFNVYISSQYPIDSWEYLKKPIQLKDKNFIQHKMFYIHKEDKEQEILRLQHSIDTDSFEINDKLPDSEKEKQIHINREQLINKRKSKQETVEKVFSYGKPFFTYVFIIINLLMFFLLEVKGGSTNTDTLLQYGAKYNPGMIEDNQWWRILSSMFIHIGFFHLLMNVMAIYYLGILVEKMYGRWRFLFIYLLSGIGGGLASFAFSVNISAGASGAIFGLFGALLFFGFIYREIFFQTLGSNVLLILAINLILGFVVQQIDMAAHIGGLVAGFIASAIIFLPKKKKIVIQLFAALVYAVSLLYLVNFGIHNNLNKQEYHLMVLEESLSDKEYEKVVKIANDALHAKGNSEAIIYFQRSYAFIKLNQTNEAIADLEKSIRYEPLPEAYYNLAYLYYEIGDEERAKENVIEAYTRNPENKDFIKLYEEITGESL